MIIIWLIELICRAHPKTVNPHLYLLLALSQPPQDLLCAEAVVTPPIRQRTAHHIQRRPQLLGQRLPLVPLALCHLCSFVHPSQFTSSAASDLHPARFGTSATSSLSISRWAEQGPQSFTVPS